MNDSGVYQHIVHNGNTNAVVNVIINFDIRGGEREGGVKKEKCFFKILWNGGEREWSR
jgi:hypothetical protein